ncbi:hypothetical protein OGAPHI_003270 [Ogataea philodendri]|uniref:EKC/KEOPS complex subunit CGI121 n=1 Tax=Ogataea philodendri TaxID=1378263 RepID=A0A9P8P824_9ASCO|nr:uncharacterized protein OGAPHI_003270 [Ogataea philodendri]KAH3666821.1 hypothetical protein OGAPHI_003270 [Ogataea philodendri]
MFKIYSFPQFPETQVFAAYFSNVSNQESIKNSLLAADPNYNYAFVNGDYLVSQEQILSAVYKALLDDSFNRKKSKSINSEIIYNLSPLKNILECLKTFGVSESPHLLAIKLINKKDDPLLIQQNLQSIVKGTPLDISDKLLQENSDLTKIHKLFNTQDSDFQSLSRTLATNTQLKNL